MVVTERYNRERYIGQGKNTFFPRMSGRAQAKRSISGCANGRFFIVEQTSGKSQKLPIPIQDGKMINDNYKNTTTEGYDNVKKKFVLTIINNHIGSDIFFWKAITIQLQKS